MKKFSSIYRVSVSMLLLLIISFSCKQSEEIILLPELTTTEVSNVTESSVQSGGFITSDAENEISSRGVCWSTKPNPTIADSVTKDAAGTGRYVSQIYNLIPNTTYYLRAYATNKNGTAYGLQETFTTKSIVLTTLKITDITMNSAMSGGSVEVPGDSSSIIDRGLCWNTQPSPTIQDFKKSNGNGVGEFSSVLSDLTANTTYYVRVYASTSKATYYGDEISFKTKIGIVSVSTASVTNITLNSATSGGSVTEIGGNSVTERGICWSTTTNPVINDSKSIEGSGIGSFTLSFTGLKNNTTYYIRAYAANIDTTYYGNEVSFKTISGIVAISSIAPSNISGTTAQVGGYISSTGGSSLIENGICWSISANPTVNDSKLMSGGGIGSYFLQLSGLTPNSTYFYRAYAINGAGLFYGNELSFNTSTVVSDVDGNYYNTITIGTQTWMVENLKTTKYNDGTSIPLVTDNYQWSILTSPAYCWCVNDASNKNKYGALYNGYVINTGKLAPEGWHIATDAEWTTLENYISVNAGKSGSVTKALSSTTDWSISTSPGAIGNNLSINNSSGFSVMPGGVRDVAGVFDKGGTDCYFWTSTGTSPITYRNFNYIKYTIYKSNSTRNYGYSVRCIKD